MCQRRMTWAADAPPSKHSSRGKHAVQKGKTGGIAVFFRNGEDAMADKFNPAPTDKHADTPKERSAADKKSVDELKKGLKDSFPASDPPSNTQPPKTVDDAG